MEVFLITFYTTIKVYSSRQKMLEGYIQLCKNFCKDYERTVRGSVYELSNNIYPEISDEHREDLLNFIKEKEYKGIFTLDELKKLDVSVEFHVITVDN